MSYGVYARRTISPRSFYPRDRDETSFPPPRRPPTAPSRVDPNSVLGVFGLSIRTRERDLEDEFMRHGDVEKVVIVYDQRVSQSTLKPSNQALNVMGVDRSIERVRVHHHEERYGCHEMH